jgi:hypothetical protein
MLLLYDEQCISTIDKGTDDHSDANTKSFCIKYTKNTFASSA